MSKIKVTHYGVYSSPTTELTPKWAFAGGSLHLSPTNLAGMPNKIVLRANEILHFLEKDRHKNEKKKVQDIPKPTPQMSLFESDPRFKEIQEMLGKVDINTISPVEALLKLNEVLAVLKK